MIALALCGDAEGKVVNIGSGEEWSIAQTVDMICEITGRSVEIISDEARIRPEKSEVNRLIADNSLIRSLTGWKSRVSFREGLSRTVDWIRSNLTYFNPTQYAR
jgi:nucleoside-diphosphate-sugar epimerase